MSAAAACSPAGLLGGTPTAGGIFNVVVLASNGVARCDAELLDPINQVPAITSGPPPATALVGAAFNISPRRPATRPAFSAHLPTAGTGPQSAGVLGGTPTTASVFAVVVDRNALPDAAEFLDHRNAVRDHGTLCGTVDRPVPSR
jgi:hypothetical protein